MVAAASRGQVDRVSRTELRDVAGVTHRWVDAEGLSVHVAEAGSGPPLVLLHGWPQHWYCWHRVVPQLAQHYRLVMPDLRGHGWTDAPASGYDKEQLASDLLATLDALELDSVGLVGHDWGGWTGFLACLRQPERFRAFLALGIVHPFQRMEPRLALQAWKMTYQVLLSTPVLAQTLMRVSPHFISTAIKAGSKRRDVYSTDDLRAYADVFREPARAQATVALYRTFLLRESAAVTLGRYRDSRLTVPTRLVSGEHDPVSSRALLDGWQPYADDMSVEVLPGYGHFLPEEAPDEVVSRVRTLFG